MLAKPFSGILFTGYTGMILESAFKLAKGMTPGL
jgi:hypothetical protein